MMKIFLAIGLLGVLLVPSIKSMKKCLKPPAVAVSDATFNKLLVKNNKWHIPLHSNCDNCEKNDKQWSAIGGRTQLRSLCWSMSGNRKDGSEFVSNFQCKYTSNSEGFCELQRDSPPHYAGSIIFTMTDNNTYIAGATCIFGKENFWWVLSKSETIDDDLSAEIQADFVRHGFQPDNVAKEGQSEIFFKEMKLREKC